MIALQGMNGRHWIGETEKGGVGKVIAEWVADRTLPDNFIAILDGATEEEDKELYKKGLGRRAVETHVKPRTFKKLQEEAAHLGCPVDVAVRKIIIDALNGNSLGLNKDVSLNEFPYELHEDDVTGGLKSEIYEDFDNGKNDEWSHYEIIQDDFADKFAWVSITSLISSGVLVAISRAAVAKKESRDEWVRRRVVSYLYSRYGNGKEGGDVADGERLNFQLEIKKQKEKFDELEASIARL